VRERRELALAVAGCALAGGLALSVGGQTWATATVTRRPPLPPVTEELTGSTLAALVPACGLLLLAAAVAVVAVRGLGRRAVGLVAAVAGGALLWSGVRRLVTEPGLGDLSDGTAAGATGLDVAPTAAWPVVTAVAGLLAVAVGVLVVVRGPGWAGMGRRYERTPATVAPARSRTPEDRALDAWRALDRGEDPTADGGGTDGDGAAGQAPPR
jgi:uncharacterized membrane protein (TIGR02234 family)